MALQVTMSSQTFYNLTVNNTGADGSDDIILADALDVNGDFTLANGDFNMGSHTMTFAGDWVSTGGSMVAVALRSLRKTASTISRINSTPAPMIQGVSERLLLVVFFLGLAYFAITQHLYRYSMSGSQSRKLIEPRKSIGSRQRVAEHI